MQTDPTFRTGKNFLPVKDQYGGGMVIWWYGGGYGGEYGGGGDEYAP